MATETVALIPGAPTLSGPLIVRGGSFTLSWTSEAGATDYLLQEALNTNFNGATSTDEGTATSAQINVGSGGDEDLYFRVHACGAGDCGAWSNTHHVLIFDGGGGFSAVPKTAMGEFELQVQHAWPEFK